jgi:hypothetical protein
MTATTGVAILGLSSRESSMSKEVASDDFFIRTDKNRFKPRYAGRRGVSEVKISKCRQRQLIVRLWL